MASVMLSSLDPYAAPFKPQSLFFLPPTPPQICAQLPPAGAYSCLPAPSPSPSPPQIGGIPSKGDAYECVPVAVPAFPHQHFVPVAAPASITHDVWVGPPPPPPPVMPVTVYYCPPPSVPIVVYGFPAALPPAAAPTTRRCSITLIEEGGAGDEPTKHKLADEPSPRKAVVPFRTALPPPPPPPPSAASALGFTASTTSLMIRNIPNKFLKERVIAILDQHCAEENRKLRSRRRGVKSEYDFLYVPIDFRTRCNKGYAFVNMTTAAAARQLRAFLQNHRWDAALSAKVCDVVPAAVQGRDAFVSHFSASWFPCNTKAFLPVWFDPPRDGVQQTKAHVVGRIVTRPRG